MGWKTVKERYKIGHTVHVVGDCIWIGSAFISKIIAIGPLNRLDPASKLHGQAMGYLRRKNLDETSPLREKP